MGGGFIIFLQINILKIFRKQFLFTHHILIDLPEIGIDPILEIFHDFRDRLQILILISSEFKRIN